MNEALDTLCYLQEQTSFEEDYAGKFGYEVHDLGSRLYVDFDAVLQSFGDKNRNGRAYDADNIWDCICTDDYIQSMLQCNSWLGERDHPSAELTGQELTLNRISNPQLGNTSHYIRSPRLTPDKTLLEAKIQTDSSTDAGTEMAIKIIDGKMIPCFSARVLGALQKRVGIPVVHVRKLITYDWVLYPSHKQAMAKIQQPIMEAATLLATAAACKMIMLPELAKMAMNNDEGMKWLCESFELTENDLLGVTETGNSVMIQEKGQNVYLQPITDARVRSKTQSMVADWLHQ